ncbi:MAG: hypothetical protein OEY43_04105 [Gammaproteobacteria bacterium]|nr:hypothetical protein [Gammaproteobacteria bacterium]
MTQKKACALHKLSNLNMLLGLLVFAVAVYLIVTGSYDSLQARKQTEALLNVLSIGGLIYTAAFWYIKTFVVNCRPVANSGA